MERARMMKQGVLRFGFALSALALPVVHAETIMSDAALVGTWSLAAADVEHPDGTREHDYGNSPKGLLLIDAQGHYSLQIFKAERSRFASADKSAGTAEEYKGAVMGASTHFGWISVNPVVATLIFHIENASFPNWEGEQQKRTYTLKDGELSYRVTPRPNGDVPISIWRRIN